MYAIVHEEKCDSEGGFWQDFTFYKIRRTLIYLQRNTSHMKNLIEQLWYLVTDSEKS
jgi:hypothetical protein